MQSKLRELAERWKEQSEWNSGGRAKIQCAAELLAILDAEGDGGAVGEVVRNESGQMYLKFADGKTIADFIGSKLYTHPARSGVVRDEDVWGSLNAWDAKAGYSIIERMRAALEHFAKGERHER